MNKTKLYGWIIIGLLISNIVLIVGLSRKANRPHHRRHGPKQIIIDRLHFDKGQIAKYIELIPEHRSLIEEKDHEIRSTKRKLLSLLKEEKFELEDSLILRISSLQAQIEGAHLEHFRQIKGLCKSDQLASFDELVDDLDKLFSKGGHGPRPPRGRH